MDASVKNTLSTLRALEREEADAHALVARMRTQIAEQNKKLVGLLEEGGTTGDRLADLVIRMMGRKDDEMLEHMRSLEQKLKGKKGEFVLFKYSSETRVRYGGEVRPGDWDTRTRFRLGILAADQLVLGKYGQSVHSAITLPVERYLTGDWPHPFDPMETERVEGDFFQWTIDHPPPLHTYVIDEEQGKDLIVGDAALRTALAAVVGLDAEAFFNEAAAKLGRLILQPTG